jgi:hypothetical protein
MGQVISSASMSLDGYIAKADNTIGHLFDWMQNGDVELATASPTAWRRRSILPRRLRKSTRLP